MCEKRIYYDILLTFKKPKRREKAYIEIPESDLLKLLEYTKNERRDYYGVLYMNMRFGWRRGQVIAIRKKDISWCGLYPIELRMIKTKTKKPFIWRDIDPELANIIKMYAQANNKSEWLFPNRNNEKHSENHYTAWISYHSKKALGYKLTPHDFRHSFCTNMLNEGHADRDIMAITGHEDKKSFDIYTHRTSAGTKKVIESSKLFS